MSEPTHQRVPKDNGTTKSLKMSIGKKKLHENPDLARMVYKSFVINGVQYCRRHLLISCHLCEDDGYHLYEEANGERELLGLRPGGDPRLNERAEKWRHDIVGRRQESNVQMDAMALKYGRKFATTHPEQWQDLIRTLRAQEREVNDRFLAENDDILQNKGTSQCCYWACETPAGREDKPLLKCAGCGGIVKYCCKDHQRLDWVWEHKGECTSNVPASFQQEMTEDRQTNLNGDYTEYRMK